ncbi:gliding motility-associated C-terminal domain-containing protein [Flavivirga spongiicola]|uniref:Gliding motility-associated C-terminal domain-containing protein n=1 Tax=Flavivirga spongiicola TaxID=421621 RepID=A0ABU7XZH5_9FLAO|nr:gliding motility-associated C-terminal domain-containing protein [Flavivirga sp. MEBiC05379]MDO5980835.1 gliding motility-associated C-terminal domain-containing protein [Flavivirga sp. MEBiC05379]
MNNKVTQTLIGKKYNVLLIIFLMLFGTQMALSQCDPNNAIVIPSNSTCPANGRITAVLPGGGPCVGQFAILTTPSGVDIPLNVNIFGVAQFNDLAPGDYNLRFINGSTTIQYQNNPITVTTSYQDMDISFSSTAPSCPNNANQSTPDGTLTVNVNSSTFNSFTYQVISPSSGTQTFGPTTDTSHTFNGMNGGEQVTLNVTDDICGVTQTETPTINANTTGISDVRIFTMRRDCTIDCNRYIPFIEYLVFSPEGANIVQLPGNATISINGGTPQNLTVNSFNGVSMVFTYPPGISGGANYTLRFNNGCSVLNISETAAPIDNNLLDFTVNGSLDPTTCAQTFTLQSQAEIVPPGSRATHTMFCTPSATVAIQEISSPGTFNTSFPLDATNRFSASLPRSGTYRLTVADACHTVVKTFNTPPNSSPLDQITINDSESVLEGTFAISVHNPVPIAAPITYTINPVPFVASKTINPTHPFTLGGTYTINFPVVVGNTGNITPSKQIGDIPPGDYTLTASYPCGAQRVIPFSTGTITEYTPQITPTAGCVGSGSIQFDMNETNAFFHFSETELWTNNGSGGLGTLVQGEIPPTGYSGIFNNISQGDYLLRFNNVSSPSILPNNADVFSVATSSSNNREFLAPVTIDSFEIVTGTTIGGFCDANNPSTGFVFSEVTSSSPTYPITFELFQTASPITPVQSFTINNASGGLTHLFENVAQGDYFVRISSLCGSVNLDTELVPPVFNPVITRVSNNVICFPGENIQLSINLPNNLFDITWVDDQGNNLGSGNLVTVFINSTTTYTANYIAKTTFCPGSQANSTSLEVSVTDVEGVESILDHIDVSCNGGNDGAFTIIPSGGAIPYSFSLDNVDFSNTTGIFTGLTAGSHTIYIRDTSGCEDTTSLIVTITEPDAITLANTPVVDPILCNGDTTTVTFIATGGTAPYVYTFNGETNATGVFNNVAAAIGLAYSITDANSCAAATGNVDVIQPDAITLANAPVVDPILCNGDTTTVTFTAAGSTAPYAYTFNGETNATGIFNNVAAGTGLAYSITDANSCAAATGNVDVIQPDAITLANTPVVDPILCNGDTTTVTFTATGGTAPYAYTFNGETNATGIFNNVAAGTGLAYSITDANSCAAATGTIEITQPDAITLASIPVVDPILCNGDTTTVTFTATGGTAPYAYTFNGETNATGIFNNVAAGTGLAYSFTDVNTCTAATGTIDIIQPDAITLANTPVVDPILCNGNTTTVTFTATGGTAPYAYTFNGETNATGIFNNVAAGTGLAYSFTDVNTCTAATGTIDVIQPDAIVLIANGEILAFNGATDGNVTGTVSGGTAPYTVILSGDASDTIIVATDGGAFDFSNLSAGNYVVTIQDANFSISNTGCEVIDNVQITQPDSIILIVNGETLACNGDTDGNVTGTITGGVAPYTVILSGDGSDTTTVATDGGTFDFSNLPAGNYIITVQDANFIPGGNDGQAIDNAQITQPDEIETIEAIADHVDVSCFGGNDGAFNVDASGGSGSFTYTTTINGNPVTNTDGEFSGLASGDYTVTVNDANVTGCLDPTPITVTITQPDAITLANTPVVNPILCNGDTTTVTFTATGGTAPYAYAFNGETNATGVFNNVAAGTGLAYSITDANSCAAATGNVDVIQPDAITLANAPVVDPILCNGDTTTVTFTATGGTAPYAYTFNGETNATGIFNNVAAGTGLAYSITDVNTCTAATGTIDIIQPDAITLASIPVVDPILCNGDTTTVTFTATGGMAPYAYTFNGETNATGLFNNVAAGTNLVYSITDANTCTAATGTVDVIQPDAITLANTPVVDPILCNGDTTTVTFTATGGTAPYSYTFNGETNDTGIFANVAAGTALPYSITDANNCAAVTGTLDITQPEVISLIGTPEVDPILCNGDTTTVTFTATGGTAPYSYTFNGETNDTGIFTGVSAGTGLPYSVTDANTCTPATGTVDVVQPDAITLTNAPVVDPILCNGDTTTVTFTATGGTAPYSYTFNGETNDTGIFTGVSAGTGLPYSVTDANTCTPATGTVDVVQPDAITLTNAPVVDPILCNGDTTTVTFTATGGTAPYSYIFNGETNDTGIFTGVSAGTGLPYSVTDANTCTPATGIVDVIQPDAITLTNAPVVDPILCNGDTTTVTFTATGGTAPYSYTFNGETNDTGIFANVAAGTALPYSITDANNCTAVTGTLDITEPEVISLIGTPEVDPILCNGDLTTVTFTATGGIAPYSYTFNGQTNDTGIFANVAAGTVLPYSITDANNCAAVTGTLDITQPEVISLIGTPEVDLILCNGDTTTVTFTATGGIAPYEYSFNGETNDTGVFTNVASGTGLAYSVTDANMCTPATGTLDITQPDAITLASTPEVDPILCNDDTTTVTFTATGGTAPYSYTFNGQVNDTGIFTNVLAGTGLTYSVTDVNNCAPAAGAIDITQPEVLGVIVDSMLNVDCDAGILGEIILRATGGTAPYIYSIDNGVTSQDSSIFSDLVPDVYNILVTDNNGCFIFTDDIVIELLEANPIVLDVVACEDDGIIDLDTFLTNQPTNGTWIFTSGPNDVILNGSVFDPSDLPLGDYIFTYTATTMIDCVSSTEVTINLHDRCIVFPCSSEDVIISKGVTPNGDQHNQFFAITGVENCDFIFNVKIFNRWGSLVFQSNNYQNNWSGESSKNSLGSANTLPSGTYYYIVNIQNSGIKPITGPIYLGTK